MLHLWLWPGTKGLGIAKPPALNQDYPGVTLGSLSQALDVGGISNTMIYSLSILRGLVLELDQ